MRATLDIPADLTPVMRKATLEIFANVAHEAGRDHPTDEDRHNIRHLDALVEALGTRVELTEPVSIALIEEHREVLLQVIDWALYEGDLDKASPEKVVAVGKRFERLLALRADLQDAD
jgi:hypothetical protein